MESYIKDTGIPIQKHLVVCDSTTVIRQLRSKSQYYNAWSLARIRHVQARLDCHKIMHVEGVHNLSDVVTKSIKAGSLRSTLEGELWSRGGKFQLKCDQWPVSEVLPPKHLSQLPDINEKYRHYSLASLGVDWLYVGNDLELRPFIDPMKLELAIDSNILNYDQAQSVTNRARNVTQPVTFNNVTLGSGVPSTNKYLLSVRDQCEKLNFYEECKLPTYDKMYSLASVGDTMESLRSMADQTGEVVNLLKISKIVKQRKTAPLRKAAYRQLKVDPDFLKKKEYDRDSLLQARVKGDLDEPFALFLQNSRSLSKSLRILAHCLSWPTSNWRYANYTLPELVTKVQNQLEIKAAPHAVLQAYSLKDKSGLFMHEGKVFRKQRKILDSDFPLSVQLISPHSYYGVAICVDLHHRLHAIDVRRAKSGRPFI